MLTYDLPAYYLASDAAGAEHAPPPPPPPPGWPGGRGMVMCYPGDEVAVQSRYTHVYERIAADGA